MKTTSADKWFSLYIRIRDCDENRIAKCCTCGKVIDVKYADCGHFIKRQHMATRFDEKNCAAQCKYCNRFEQGKDVDFERYLIKRWGEDAVLLLKSGKRNTKKMSTFELDLLAIEYKQKAVELAKEKGIEPW